MSLNAEVQSANSSTVTNINDGSCSGKGNTNKCTDDKDALGDDHATLTASQLRKLRRGRKLKRSGRTRPKKKKSKGDKLIPKNDTLILGNLPLFFTVDAVEYFLKQTTGLSKDNCSFYIEISRQPGQCLTEAVIQFLHEEHLLLALRPLQATSSPFTVEMLNNKTLGYRIPQGFRERSRMMLNIMNTLETHISGTKGAVQNNVNNKGHMSTDKTTETSKNPGSNQHAEDKQKTSFNYVDMKQEESSNNDSASGNTQNKIPSASPKDDVREMFSAPSLPPPTLNMKSKQIDAHYADSDDSTETIVLKQEPIDFDEMTTVAPEPNEFNDELPIKQELIDNSNNNSFLAVSNVKEEPQDLHENHTQVTQNSEFEAAIDESANAIDDILNNIELSEIIIKHEVMDTDDDNRTVDPTTNNESVITATNEKQSSSVVPTEISNKSSEVNDVTKPPTPDRDEITCEPTTSGGQAVANKKTSSKMDRSNKSPPSDHVFVTETATTDSPTRTNKNKKISTPDQSDAHNCKIVHIKNLPLINEERLQRIIKFELIDKINNDVVDGGQVTNEPLLIHIPHDEIEHKTLGEALVKFKTNAEALRACNVLNGINVRQKLIEVQLYIGHKISKEHKFVDCQALTKCRKRRRNKGVQNQNDEEPAAKQNKDMESELPNTSFDKRNYLPPVDRNCDLYGLKPAYLQKLGLKAPLTNTVIVRELHELVDEDKLYEVFSMAGDVKNIILFDEKRRARIEYDHPVEAVQAIQMFRDQKLFNGKIVMHMEPVSQPRPLPLGLSGINRGFARNGEPLRGVRASIELRNIHEILYECGKMNKFEYNNISDPFNVWYGKRAKNKLSIDSASIASPIVITPAVSNKPSETNQNTQSSTDTDTIEALGAVLKARGLIPVETDCKDARNILIALCSEENDPSHAFSNSPTINTSQLNNMYIPNAATNSANVTQSFAQGVPQTNVPQNFAYGTQIPRAMPNQTIKPSTAINWEPVTNAPAHPGQSSTIYRSEDRKRREDYPRDPRITLKERDSDQSGRVIFKNLPLSISQAVLANKMSEVGEVLFCEMSSAGGAIVAFKTSQDAERCFRLFNRTKVDGQVIEVICV